MDQEEEEEEEKRKKKRHLRARACHHSQWAAAPNHIRASSFVQMALVTAAAAVATAAAASTFSSMLEATSIASAVANIDNRLVKDAANMNEAYSTTDLLWSANLTLADQAKAFRQQDKSTNHLRYPPHASNNHNNNNNNQQQQQQEYQYQLQLNHQNNHQQLQPHHVLLLQQQQSTWSLLLTALFYKSDEFDINWFDSILAIILIMLMLTTAIGNLFVIVAILIERNLRTIGNYLVLSLAIADLLVACLVMPFAGIYQILGHWTLGVLVCDIWTSADVFCCTASILHLLAIALDRYWAVTRVDYIRCQRNEQRILFMILFVWMAAIVIALAPVFGWKDAQFEWRITNDQECLISQDIAYQIFATCTTFYLPLTLTLIFYWKIYQVARKRIRRKPGNRVKISLQHPSTSSSNSSPGFRQQQQQQQPRSKQLCQSVVECSMSDGSEYKSSILLQKQFVEIDQPKEKQPTVGAVSNCQCSCHIHAQQSATSNQLNNNNNNNDHDKQSNLICGDRAHFTAAAKLKELDINNNNNNNISKTDRGQVTTHTKVGAQVVHPTAKYQGTNGAGLEQVDDNCSSQKPTGLLLCEPAASDGSKLNVDNQIFAGESEAQQQQQQQNGQSSTLTAEPKERGRQLTSSVLFSNEQNNDSINNSNAGKRLNSSSSSGAEVLLISNEPQSKEHQLSAAQLSANVNPSQGSQEKADAFNHLELLEADKDNNNNNNNSKSSNPTPSPLNLRPSADCLDCRRYHLERQRQQQHSPQLLHSRSITTTTITTTTAAHQSPIYKHHQPAHNCSFSSSNNDIHDSSLASCSSLINCDTTSAFCTEQVDLDDCVQIKRASDRASQLPLMSQTSATCTGGEEIEVEECCACCCSEDQQSVQNGLIHAHPSHHQHHRQQHNNQDQQKHHDNNNNNNNTNQNHQHQHHYHIASESERSFNSSSTHHKLNSEPISRVDSFEHNRKQQALEDNNNNNNDDDDYNNKGSGNISVQLKPVERRTLSESHEQFPTNRLSIINSKTVKQQQSASNGAKSVVCELVAPSGSDQKLTSLLGPESSEQTQTSLALQSNNRGRRLSSKTIFLNQRHQVASIALYWRQLCSQLYKPALNLNETFNVLADVSTNLNTTTNEAGGGQNPPLQGLATTLALDHTSQQVTATCRLCKCSGKFNRHPSISFDNNTNQGISGVTTTVSETTTTEEESSSRPGLSSSTTAQNIMSVSTTNIALNISPQASQVTGLSGRGQSHPNPLVIQTNTNPLRRKPSNQQPSTPSTPNQSMVAVGNTQQQHHHHHHHSHHHNNQQTAAEGLESKRERKAAKTLAIITGVFVMCWLPFFVMALAMPLLDIRVHKNILGLLVWLGYVNSMLNPIIYTIFSPDFRKAFKRLLCGIKYKNERRGHQMASPVAHGTKRKSTNIGINDFGSNNMNNRSNRDYIESTNCCPELSKRFYICQLFDRCCSRILPNQILKNHSEQQQVSGQNYDSGHYVSNQASHFSEGLKNNSIKKDNASRETTLHLENNQLIGASLRLAYRSEQQQQIDIHQQPQQQQQLGTITSSRPMRSITNDF